jgi:transcription initiation factor TFIID TATA-box-binding protein
MMESLTLPTTAAQAKAFISPSSLSFPMSHADQIAERNGLVNGAGMASAAAPAPAQSVNGANGVEQKETVTTGGVSGIVPTLQ